MIFTMFICLHKKINIVIYEDENNFWAKDPKLVQNFHTGVTIYCSIRVGKKNVRNASLDQVVYKHMGADVNFRLT